MSASNDFVNLVLGKVNPDRKFETQVFYDQDGDCIEFLASNEDFYAERIDALVTVYYGRQSGEIVGSLIKGVRSTIEAILKKLPGFQIEIEDGRIRLEHLFTAKLWSAEDEPARLTYRKLREVADRTNAEAELVCAS